MAYKPLEYLLPRSGYSVYKLVRMASQRATELAEGKPRLIENPTTEKMATIALDEILAGKVELREVAEKKGVDIKALEAKVKEHEEKARQEAEAAAQAQADEPTQEEPQAQAA